MDCEQETREEGCVVLSNPHIAKMPEDHLYHLSLSTGRDNLEEMFGDVKFVCVGGTPKRMENFAHFVKHRLGIKLPTGTDLYDIGHCSYRYAMYKIGPVLSVSHGMGNPSLSILLHEVIKLVSHARCKDVTFIRIGTCGGIGLDGGTLVISKEVVDPLLRPYLKLHILGKPVERPSTLDTDLAEELLSLAEEKLPQYPTVLGKTMCTYDFYEGQGRLDGAFCEYDEQQKQDYMATLSNAGVTNIEMESLVFAAMCHQAKIRGAVVCVTLLDRLQDDQVKAPKELLTEWQNRPQELVIEFIKKRLGIN